MTMTPTITDVTGGPAFGHEEAMAQQATELDRTIALLRTFDDGDWSASTDCPDWDVRRMYLHVLGACESGASVREMLHQLRAARRHQRAHGGPLEACLSGVQVQERIDVGSGDLVERLAAVAPRTIRSRTRMPRLLRRATTKVDGPVVERWSLGYLTDTIYLRDLWMHRVDACRATGRAIELTADHDGRIVADVVTEWARRHGQPVRLDLGGPAGGAFVARGADGTTSGPEPEPLALDAVEFCRVLAGRSPGDGLLSTIVPF